MERVARDRIHSLVVLLENVMKADNCSAIVRSMDAFGVQILHRLYKNSLIKLNPSKADAGSFKWINISSWNNTAEYISHVKAKGFKIISTCPQAERTIYDLDFREKMVLAFGNETKGVSISVAVGITLFHASTCIKRLKV